MLIASALTTGALSASAASSSSTVVFAVQGLGAEQATTNAAIAGFEKANPSIKVKTMLLSSNTSDALQQLTNDFTSGSSTPDIIESDIIYPAEFAKAGWILPLTKFHPNMNQFFSSVVKTVTYKGQYYGMPWFINAQGLFYRTDLVPTPPKTPQQLVTDAQAAMKKDTSLKEGIAFEGAKYEGVICDYQDILGGFGGSLNVSNLNTSANAKALQYMHDLVYKYKIAPASVTAWEETNVQDAFVSGQSAFAINWPYLFPLVNAKGSSIAGKVAWIPFPSSTGHPSASLGGDDLVINKASQNQAAAWKFIQYLESPQVQAHRMIVAGDAPAVHAAYTAALTKAVPYLIQAEKVFAVTAARPVSPEYSQISLDLQTMLSSVLSNQTSAQAALSQTAPLVKKLFVTGNS
ncbi:MAG: transporter substrate-binding protein [Acidimicrobiaceae bacterium]|nr:transporter substrate-binding protein [Acidimicrobiaceae bacterium]